MAAERVLNSAPSLLPLFARSAAGLIPGSSRLPLIGRGGRSIPEVALSLAAVSVQRERLIAYDRVCAFRLTDRLPPTYIHILAFPLHLALLTDPEFPFPALGLVHVGNRITQHRRVDVSERLSLRVWPTPLEPHPRGKEFCLRTEARVGEELVWEEVTRILKRGESGSSGAAAGTKAESGSSGAAAGTRAESGSSGAVAGTRGESGSSGAVAGTKAEFGSSGAVAGTKAEFGSSGAAAGTKAEFGSSGAVAGTKAESEQLPATAVWRLRGDLGRRYAAVSGDVNLIHIHPLGAKLFGFPAAIAHGMWTKARCLAALEGRLPDAFTVEVAFRRPILLPAKVAFAEAPRKALADAGAPAEALADAEGARAGVRFQVRDARKETPHLEGSVCFG